MSAYYFFGEFGYLLQVVLPYMQRFVKQNPTRAGSITLYTYEGNDYIINTLFPGFFQFHTVSLHPSRGCYNCMIDNDFPNTKHISSMFSEEFPQFLGKIDYTGDLSAYYLDAPLPCPSIPSLDELRSKYKNTIVLFLRKRDLEAFRNFTEDDSDEWTILLKQKCSDPSTLCCVYAVSKDECVIPSFLSAESPNVRLIKTMEEAIYFFHTCDTCYMNDSGLNDLAKLCKTKHIVIRPGANKILFNSGLYYNPFGTKIEIFGEYRLAV